MARRQHDRGAIGQRGESIQDDPVLAGMGAGDQQRRALKVRALDGQGGLVDRQRRGAELQVGLAGDLAAENLEALVGARVLGQNQVEARQQQARGVRTLLPTREAAVRKLGRDQGQPSARRPWPLAAGWATARSRRRRPGWASSAR
jgi:hypothetical protein